MALPFSATWIAQVHGPPLLSALLDTILQRHCCRIKDWGSQANWRWFGTRAAAGEAPHRLHTSLMSTFKAFVWTVVAIIAVYVTGFAALTSMYMASVQQCKNSTGCGDSIIAMKLWRRRLLLLPRQCATTQPLRLHNASGCSRMYAHL